MFHQNRIPGHIKVAIVNYEGRHEILCDTLLDTVTVVMDCSYYNEQGPVRGLWPAGIFYSLELSTDVLWFLHRALVRVLKVHPIGVAVA